MMKQLKYFLSFLLISISIFAQEIDCTYNGKPLRSKKGTVTTDKKIDKGTKIH